MFPKNCPLFLCCLFLLFQFARVAAAPAATKAETKAAAKKSVTCGGMKGPSDSAILLFFWFGLFLVWFEGREVAGYGDVQQGAGGRVAMVTMMMVEG